MSSPAKELNIKRESIISDPWVFLEFYIEDALVELKYWRVLIGGDRWRITPPIKVISIDKENDAYLVATEGNIVYTLSKRSEGVDEQLQAVVDDFVNDTRETVTKVVTVDE